MKWFQNILVWPGFLPAARLSASLAIVSTLTSLVLGTLAAYGLVRFKYKQRAVLLNTFLIPLTIPSIVLAVGISMLLTPLGLMRTFTGLLIAHVLLTLPYVVRTVTSALLELDRSLTEAASTLGARRWTSFWKIEFPLLMPGLLAASVFSFIISFDEFTVSLFVVGPGLMTLPIEIYNYTEFSLDPTVAAISTVLILISALSIFAVERLVGLGKQFGK